MLKKISVACLMFVVLSPTTKFPLVASVGGSSLTLFMPVQAAPSAPQRRFKPALSGNVSRAQTERIVSRLAGQRFDSFSDFVIEVYKVGESFLSNEQKNAIAKFVAHGSLTDTDREIMFRVLGIFAQLKYGGESLRLLNELLKSHNDLQGPLTLQLKKQAERFDMRFRAVNEWLFELRFSKRTAAKRSEGGKRVLFYIPLNSDFTGHQQKEGAQPLSKLNGLLYGQHLRAGNSALAVALHAMRVVQEENVKLHNDVRMLIGVGDAPAQANLDYYLKTFPRVDYVIRLDDAAKFSSVPLTSAQEKKPNSLHRTTRNVYAENLGIDRSRVPNSPLVMNPLLGNGYETTFRLSEPAPLESDTPSEPHSKMSDKPKPLEEFLFNIQMLTELIARLGQQNRFQ